MHASWKWNQKLCLWMCATCLIPNAFLLLRFFPEKSLSFFPPTSSLMYSPLSFLTPTDSMLSSRCEVNTSLTPHQQSPPPSPPLLSEVLLLHASLSLSYLSLCLQQSLLLSASDLLSLWLCASWLHLWGFMWMGGFGWINVNGAPAVTVSRGRSVNMQRMKAPVCLALLEPHSWWAL